VGSEMCIRDSITAHINELKEKEQIKDEPDICDD
jgi:hypothetical protein